MPLDHQPALEGDVRTDVCVVGAGFTGLSAALHLAERGYAVRVVEAQRVGWGASGRNGGQVASGQNKSPDAIARHVGREAAGAAFRIGVDAAQLVRDLIDRHKIECSYRPGVIGACHRRRYVAGFRRQTDDLARDYEYHSARFLDRAEIEDITGTPAYHGGAIDMASGHLHPLNFARGLARAAMKAGAIIHELSEVTAPPQNGLVTTQNGQIQAEHVVLACNAYMQGIAPQIEARVMPINSYIIATEPIPRDLAASILKDDVAVFDTRFVVNYFRLSEDRRMLFGGRESYGYRFPGSIAPPIRARMLALYPQLKDVRVTHSWGGSLAITRNRLPCFARIGPCMLSCSGYSGSGVAMATMAGAIAAETVAGQAERFDTMAALPSPAFPGGASLRHPLLFLAMVSASLADRR